MKAIVKSMAVPKRLMPLLLAVLLLAGCKSSKTLTAPVTPETSGYLSSKLQLTVPTKDSSITLGGTMKLKGGERLQLSLLMPIIRSEVMRMDITPDEVLLVDRMNKRYVRATRQELKDVLPPEADFDKLQKMLFKASRPGAKADLTGSELGLPKMEKAKVRLYDFSDAGFTMTPTEVSDRYTRVELEDLIKHLPKL